LQHAYIKHVQSSLIFVFFLLLPPFTYQFGKGPKVFQLPRFHAPCHNTICSIWNLQVKKISSALHTHTHTHNHHFKRITNYLPHCTNSERELWNRRFSAPTCDCLI
jgi:hypothetical protein